jgi:hypothetical protein
LLFSTEHPAAGPLNSGVRRKGGGVRAYREYDESGIEELGDISREQVPQLIADAEESLTTAKQFGVGFYRTEQDFLEIRPVGKSQYMIWSDKIAENSASSFFGRLFQKRGNIYKVVTGRERAIESVLFYMDYSREAFERKYS